MPSGNRCHLLLEVNASSIAIAESIAIKSIGFIEVELSALVDSCQALNILGEVQEEGLVDVL